MKIDLASEKRFGQSRIDKQSLFLARDFSEKKVFVALGRTSYYVPILKY